LLVLTALFVYLTQFQIQLANLRLRLSPWQRRILSYLTRPFEVHHRLARRPQAQRFVACGQAALESGRFFPGGQRVVGQHSGGDPACFQDI
jgi:hypothetical protein